MKNRNYERRGLSFLLALALMLSILTVFPLTSALAAEGEGILTVENVKCEPGATIQVPVMLTANPGVVSMKLNISYDESVMALVDIMDGGILGEFILEDKEAYASPAAVAWYNFTAETDFTLTGTLVTLVFEVSQQANGVYPITVSYDPAMADILNKDAEPVPFTVENGAVTAKYDVSEILRAQLALSEDITVRYYAHLAAAETAAEMVFTMNGKETRVAGVATATEGEYCFAFENIAPQCMTDVIDAALVLDGKTLDTHEGFTLRGYCDEIVAADAASLGMSEAKKEKLDTLAAELLHYGAAAQNYRSYKTETPADANFAVAAGEFTPLDEGEWENIIDETGTDGLQFTAAGIYYSNTNSIYLRFVVPEDLTLDDIAIRVTNLETNEVIVYKGDAFVEFADGEYMLLSAPLGLENYGIFYSFELCTYNKRGGLADQQYVDYSIYSYISKKQNQTDANGEPTAMALLAQATYQYSAAAVAYANEA